MKKIIKHGYGQFHVTCEYCTCHFTYELEDVDALGFVTCPECGHACYHDTTNPVRTSTKLEVKDE